MNDQATHWTQADDRSCVLAAFDSTGLCISTMRGTPVPSQRELERVLECTIGEFPSLFPALALRKAATSNHVLGLGLNSLLRLHFVKLAAESSLRSVVGIVYTGAPRIHTLKEIGYQFIDLVQFKDAALKPISTAHLAYLTADRFDSAIAWLGRKTEGLADRFPLTR